MRRIAILMTCHNRKEKTLRCLDSLRNATLDFDVYLTDDGCTDGTADAIRANNYNFTIQILQADGTLFWNAGMNNSWRAAIAHGGYDGYLWLNDDTVVLPEFWKDMAEADSYCRVKYGKAGIYVGSTKDEKSGKFSYGGFFFVNKITLKDRFVLPDGESFQECEAAHGNITYISDDAVKKMGVLCDKYHHGGGDHDYTYLAHKAGFPLLVLPHYCAYCENDHIKKYVPKPRLSLSQRVANARPPKGYHMYNTLLFNRRCFPWRLPLVFILEWARVLSPALGRSLYRTVRGQWNK